MPSIILSGENSEASVDKNHKTVVEKRETNVIGCVGDCRGAGPSDRQGQLSALPPTVLT